LPRQGRPRKNKTGLEKSDVRAFLREGERITGAYAVVRPGAEVSSVWTPAFEYTLFVSITGLRGYYPWLATDSGAPKVYKSFDRMLRGIRELGYQGAVLVYDEADPKRPAEPTGATKRRPGDKACPEE
jgi:hypothetical protein